MKQTSNAGIELIKSHEGLRLEAYIDPVGVLTIGYGHTKNVFPNQIITEREADSLLMSDIVEAERAVNNLVKSDLTQSQFDALVSFVFNLGAGSLQRSTLLKKINQDSTQSDIAFQFQRWDKGRVNGVLVPLPGLVKRRKEEAELYFSDLKKKVKQLFQEIENRYLSALPS